MKHILSIILAAFLCTTATAQTIRALSYNATNGQVIANTGTNVLTFTNVVRFNNGELGTYGSGFYGFSVSLDLETRRIQDSFLDVDVISWSSGLTIDFGLPLTFSTNAATTRANLGFSTNLNALWTATNASEARSVVGLGLPALTNTSNVTTMRALAGSTNTNQPYSGTIEITDGNNDYVSLIITNGIIVGWQFNYIPQ